MMLNLPGYNVLKILNKSHTFIKWFHRWFQPHI